MLKVGWYRMNSARGKRCGLDVLKYKSKIYKDFVLVREICLKEKKGSLTGFDKVRETLHGFGGSCFKAVML